MIQHELGEMDVFQQELNDLRDRLSSSDMPEDVQDKAGRAGG